MGWDVRRRSVQPGSPRWSAAQATEPKDASSIEARPLAVLARNPEFIGIAKTHGLEFDDSWVPGTESAAGNLLEIHGPAEAPLLSPVTFHVRSQGWQRLAYKLSGPESDLPHVGSVVAAPINEFRAFFSSAESVGATCRIEVRATGAAGSAHGAREFRIAASIVPDLVDAYEVALYATNLAYFVGSPTIASRAGQAAVVALNRIRGALNNNLETGTLQALRQGCHFALRGLEVEVAAQRMRIIDKDYHVPQDIHGDSKHAHHAAEEELYALHNAGLGLVGQRTLDDLDPMFPVLGYTNRAAFKRRVDPPLEDVLAAPTDFVRGYLKLLSHSSRVNVEQMEVAGPAREEHYDLVNGLYTAGWAYWITDSCIALTDLGRNELDELLKADKTP
jgi:hypothetical protein